MEKTFSIKYPWRFAQKDRNTIVKFILYVIWPFGAWLACLKSANTKTSYIIFFLFSLLLCWHMAPNSISLYDDFLGILERYNNTNISTDQLLTQIRDYFLMNDNAPKELYEIVMIWFVKLFTNNYHFYFLVCAIPVTYFQLKTLQFITLDKKYIATYWYAMAMMFLLIFPRDIITVQNPRFATGLWLGIYFCIKRWSSGSSNILTILPVVLCPLIHSGLWPFTIVVILFEFISNVNVRILEIAALISIPLSFINTDIFVGFDFSHYVPSNFVGWVDLYNSEDAYADLHGDTRAGYWWVSWIFQMIKQITYAAMVIYLIKHNKSNTNFESKRFYPFFLYILFIINIVQSIPEIGTRYYWFLQIFTAFMWFKAVYPNKSIYVKTLLIGLSMPFFYRYGYVMGGALAVNTPIDIFCTPLPYLMGKGLFW